MIKRLFKDLPSKKDRFIESIVKDGRVLDVGCGNNSPHRVKVVRPDIYYVGIDIGDYNQTKPNLADEYIISQSDEFHDTIGGLGKKFDAVISSHNLEHCNNRELTLDAMLSVLTGGGGLYLSFPSDASINFPSRQGTLNYFDDKTHTENPPDFDEIVNKLKSFGMEILYSSRYHKPFLHWFIGLLTEPASRIRNKVRGYTWYYWGFESIIIGKLEEED